MLLAKIIKNFNYFKFFWRFLVDFQNEFLYN